MPRIEEWVRLYASPNKDVRVRAARGLLARSREAPLELLFEILSTLSLDGLGADAQKALLQRREKEVVPRMIALLESKSVFVRQVACKVLGNFGDTAATPHLLRAIDDSHVIVRCAASFALAALKDPASRDALMEQQVRRRNDDTNVVIAIECAIKSLEEEFP